MIKRTAVLIGVAGALSVAAALLYMQPWQKEGRPGLASQPSQSSGKLIVPAESLMTPWSVVFYDTIPLISSRDTGQILELLSNGSTRVAGTVTGAVRRGEGGLLGLAVDGQKRLYAYYTTASDNRVSRFILNGERGNLSLGRPEKIIEGLPSAVNHNGGRIAFGPDGMLYVTVGDAGDKTSAQDISRLGGKILRMTPDGGVPGDNPFPNSLVHSYGHRNPQGMAWSADGTMFATEFGQNAWDELNVIKAGANYGWPIVEGVGKRDGYEDPVQQWPTRDASPSGMAYANGFLYIANLRGAVLRAVPADSLGKSREYFKDEYGRLRDVTVAPDGRLWFVTNNTDGRGTPSAADDRILSVDLGRL